MARIETESRSHVNRQPVCRVRSNNRMETIGDRVRKLREASKGSDGSQPLPRKELSAAVGMAKTTLQTLEDNNQESTKKLHRLAAYFRVRVEWLETGKGPMYETGSPSYTVRLDPAILAEAEKLVGAREHWLQTRYGLPERAQWLARVYERLMTDGGKLTNEHRAAILDDAKTGEPNETQEPTGKHRYGKK